MARTSRQERRQRRGIAAGTPPLQPARKPQTVEPVREEAPQSAAPKVDASIERQTESRGGIWGVRFIREAIAELKKVEWPTQQQVVSGTAVVLVACVIVGAYLYVNDRVWSYVVQHVLLR
jgi:preprotein translocase subunit SecE